MSLFFTEHTDTFQVGIGSVTGLEKCEVDCSHGDQYTADPMNCKNYYICLTITEPSQYPFTCEGSMFFDSLSNTCKETGYTCSPECEKCSFDCASPVLGKIASTLDCGVYYTCNPGAWTECPQEKPYFNGDICQSFQENCCTCKSYCTESDALNNKMVRDFRNCTNYYLCLKEGIPDELSHGSCPSGTVFDGQNHQCSENAPCVQVDACNVGFKWADGERIQHQ